MSRIGKETIDMVYQTGVRAGQAESEALIRELVAALDKASDNVRSANLVHEITDLLDRAKAAGYEP